MSGVLTYLTQTAIRDGIETLEAEVVSRPALLRTDGVHLTYACDVKIAGAEAVGSILERIAPLSPALPVAQEGGILRNVPLARANRDLMYAEVGAAVTLSRTGQQVEVVGFAQRKPGSSPGSRVLIPVDLEALLPEPAEDLTLAARVLTYEELATLGGYGVVPYGAYGLFRGGALVALRY